MDAWVLAVVEEMNVGKPIGGKSQGIYILLPEEEYKQYQKIARGKGMNTEEYCLWVIRRGHQCEEWRGT